MKNEYQISLTNGKEARAVLSQQSIEFAVRRTATRINEQLTKLDSLSSRTRGTVVIVVLNGAFIYAADLIRHFTFAHIVQFVKTSSYRNNKKGKFKWEIEPGDVDDKNVIVIDDICDTGETLDQMKQHLLLLGKANAVITTTLLKRGAALDKKVDQYGFLIENDDFFVGYGMDDNEYFRNLPNIYAINK